MKWVITILVTGFVALVFALVIIYKPDTAARKASALEQAIGESPAAPPASAPANPAALQQPATPSAQTETQGGQPLQSASAQPAPDAVASLKEDHAVESATQFDRALLFLAPAAPAPMIEQPVATAAATAVIPESTAPPPPAEARTWRGAVLVPKNMLLATAHTTLVRIPRIEAHPLDDGNVRIWARIQNPGVASITVGTACTFRYSGQHAEVSRGFLEVEIPPGGYYDADFLSPHAGVETYTILVKSL